MDKIPLVAVIGPTATGKSRLAAKIGADFGGEVVSADSMQVYKGFDIGTAKPSKEEMLGVPHHLIGFLEPNELFSAADFVSIASKCIEEIYRRGKLPVLAGGTGLYIRSLLYGVSFPQGSRNEELRTALYEKAEKEGPESLVEELKTFDPQSAEKIHPNNTCRLVRAIEIYRATGITMTEYVKRSKEKPSPYDTCIIGLAFRDRQKLYDRINTRVDKMMENGLAEEALKAVNLTCAPTAMQAIGYKEFIPFFKGECTLSEAVEQVKKGSRRYAKRQLTWFRRDKGVNWIMIDECGDFNEVYGKAAGFINSKGWRQWAAKRREDSCPPL